MNRFNDLEAHLAHQPGPLTDLERRGLVADLHDASMAIYRLWWAANADGKDLTAAELREASEAVRRVLTALDPQ